MRILYVSVHAILEYDDIRLLRSLGHEVFSLGTYLDPRKPVGRAFRPPIPGGLSRFDFLGRYRAAGGDPAVRRVPPEFLRLFDAVVVMHDFDFLKANEDTLKQVHVIWRSVGQCHTRWEERLEPFRSLVRIARSSPLEAFTPGTIGTDFVLRFYKDPAEWAPPLPRGDSGEVVTFFSRLKERAKWSSYDFYEAATAPFPRALYGSRNQGIAPWRGFLPEEETRVAMANAGVYFCVHTSPACYTLNFIEAWMLGAPMVCYGPEIAFPREGYEVPQLVEHGRSGFVVNSVGEAHEAIRACLGDRRFAGELGRAGREAAIRIFGIAEGRRAWSELLALHGPTRWERIGRRLRNRGLRIPGHRLPAG